jgi:hypothetical protein
MSVGVTKDYKLKVRNLHASKAARRKWKYDDPKFDNTLFWCFFSEFFSDIFSKFPCIIEPCPTLQHCSKNRSWYKVQGQFSQKNARILKRTLTRPRFPQIGWRLGRRRDGCADDKESIKCGVHALECCDADYSVLWHGIRGGRFDIRGAARSWQLQGFVAPHGSPGRRKFDGSQWRSNHGGAGWRGADQGGYCQQHPGT